MSIEPGSWQNVGLFEVGVGVAALGGPAAGYGALVVSGILSFVHVRPEVRDTYVFYRYDR